MGKRAKKVPALLCDGCFPNVDTLEHNAIAAQMAPEFTMDQFYRWVLKDEVVDKLRAAFPYVRGADQSSYAVHEMVLPGIMTGASLSCQFSARANKEGILVPDTTHWVNDPARYEPFRAVLVQAYTEHRKFETVRQVLRWLNQYATAGAAKHYCPWITGIMPGDSPFHTASGTLYREPSASMAQIMPLMRECGAIMASALLLGDRPPLGGSLSVSFRGIRTGYGPESGDNYISQAFALL